LEQFEILDSLPEQRFDDITLIAAQICQRPIALISLIDEKRQWFKSRQGLDATETPREHSFCNHAIFKPEEVMEVRDARDDERFQDNPLVVGELKVISYCGVPLVTSSGEAMGTLCVIDNKPNLLSPQQRASLKALARQVMTQMELRKQNIENEVMCNELKGAYRDLDQFAYRVAHDLKGPLNNLHHIAGVLKSTCLDQLDESGASYVSMVSELSGRLSNLVTGIMDTARIQKVNPKDISHFELREFLEEIVFIIGFDTKATVHLPQKNTLISTYRFGLHVILQNLLSNAFKYNDKAIPEVEIGFDETKDGYHFRVKDNGPGIDPQFFKTIFEQFQTLGTKDRNGKKGTGLGLSMVKELVEKMHGRIEVASVLGEGTVFHVYLKSHSLAGQN
jgi:signal transduction histidine kinase